jgi:hypothetical protein
MEKFSPRNENHEDPENPIAEEASATDKEAEEKKSVFEGPYHLGDKREVMKGITAQDGLKDFTFISDMDLRRQVMELHQQFLGGESGDYIKEEDIDRIKQQISRDLPYKQGTQAAAAKKYLDLLNNL